MEEENKKKRYTVTDRRGAADEPPAAAPAAASAAEHEAETAEQQEETAGQQRSLDTVDSLLMILNLMREHAMHCMGLILGPAGLKPETNVEEANRAADIFHRLFDRYRDALAQDLPKEPQPRPELRGTVLFCFQLLQSHILVHMGLIADPATGLVVKRPEEARASIDLFAGLLETVSDVLPDAEKRQLDGLLADLRINYVRQLDAP